MALNNTHFGVMDNLVYEYDSGNKLLKVTDTGVTPIAVKGHFQDRNKSGNDYNYDANGNMIKDLNKDILDKKITYNHLNLPTRVTIGSKNIDYKYAADGTKLRKIVNGKNTDYANGYIYEDNVLQFFSHSEGYVKKDNTGFKYVYQYKDHLGNVRLSYTDNNNDGVIQTDGTNSEIIEESNYYPFGLKHKGYNNVISSNGNSVANKFGYNNKELEESLGLNWLGYGARNYDPTIGRFMNIDRYSESFMPISTYQYGANNPVLYLDYNGDYITIGLSDDDGNKYSVLYENGKAYHYSTNKNGEVTKGKEYDGDAKFVSKALKDLNKVASTKQGGRIVNRLQKSSSGYNIVNSGNAKSAGYLDNTISYNPDKDYGFNDGVSFKKSFITLGHELAHAYDDDRGFDIGSMALGGFLPASEINAVKFENYLRATDGESVMRLNYTFKGKPNNLRMSLGGSSADYFKSYIAPLGINEEYRVRNAISPRNRSNDIFPADNTRVSRRKNGHTGVYDTKKKKFTSN